MLGQRPVRTGSPRLHSYGSAGRFDLISGQSATLELESACARERRRAPNHREHAAKKPAYMSEKAYNSFVI